MDFIDRLLESVYKVAIFQNRLVVVSWYDNPVFQINIENTTTNSTGKLSGALPPG